MIDYKKFCDKEVLITGGVGFIGSNLARRLVALGARITLVDSLIPQYGGNLHNIKGIEDRVALNVSDVRDPYAMAYLVQRKHYLFNLAGQTSHLDSMDSPHADLDINAAAQLSILEACRKCNREIKIVFASTRQLYGRPEYLPVNELHPVKPVDVNGINKLAGECYHLLYNNVYGIRSCALRLTNTYGPGMRVKDARQTFLGIWIKNVIDGKPVLVFGDGLQLRDFNYVDDVVDALLRAALDPSTEGQIFNLGSKEVVSLKVLAQTLCDLHPGSHFDIVPFPAERKAIDIGDYYGNYDRFQTAVGWQPNVGLQQGLSNCLAYYQKHQNAYWDAP